MREREGEEAGIRCGGEEEEVEMNTFSFFQFCSFFHFFSKYFYKTVHSQNCCPTFPIFC